MNWLKEFYQVWRRECYLAFTDMGVLIFFFVLPLFYPVIYTLIYNPEVVTDVPAVVVDHSRTAESRDFVRTIDATQGIHVIGYAADMGEAREALATKKCYTVFEIPADYARAIGSGGQATVSLYQDMSLLVRYRQVLLSLTGVQQYETLAVTAERVAARAGGLTTLVSGLPIGTQANIAGNPAQGFASFIIPGIVVLILQQGMLMGIAMLAGTRRDRRRRYPMHVDPTDLGAGATATVLGRAACYFTLYLPMAYYVMAIVPYVFELPQAGRPQDYMPFITVMLLATAFLGQTIQIFVRERETSMVLIVFTSVFFLFLSGLTWPRYAFPVFWKAVSDLVPATWGVEGLVHINCNGASLADVSGYLWPLWGLTAAYFATAVLLRHFTRPTPEETAVARREWEREMNRGELHADA